MYKFADEIEQEYREGLKQLKTMHESLNKELLEASCERRKLQLENELKIIRSMISDMKYAIDWIVNAAEPGNRREISRKSRYQRTSYWSDMDLFSFDVLRNNQIDHITDEEMQMLDEFLSLLTEREKDALISVVGKGNTYDTTAEYMGISRSSVQVLVNRAITKLSKGKDDGTQIEMQLF